MARVPWRTLCSNWLRYALEIPRRAAIAVSVTPAAIRRCARSVSGATAMTPRPLQRGHVRRLGEDRRIAISLFPKDEIDLVGYCRHNDGPLLNVSSEVSPYVAVYRVAV